MAKNKKDEGKYNPDDLAEFKAALAGQDISQETAGTSIDVKEERHPSNRTVSVDVEEGDTDVETEAIAPPTAKTTTRKGKPTPPPEMQKLQRRTTRSKPWGWIIGGLGLIAAASLAGWFYFNRAERFSGEKISLTVTPTAEVASGSTMSVTIEYQNQEPVDLVQSEMAVEYPAGFTFDEADKPSANEFNNAFTIGTIRTGQTGVLTISGTIIGAINTAAEFKVTLTYRPANFNSDFQTKASGTVRITSSILDLTFEGPTKLAPGASGAWTISYANTSDQDLSNVQIEAVYPDELTISKTVPTADERNAVWRIDKVAKGGQGTITITGTVNGSLGDSLTLIVRAGLVTATNTVDLQDEQSLLVILVNTGLTATVAVNGAAENSVAAAGDTLNYTIRVANKGDVEVNDVTVKVSLVGRPLKFSDLQNPMSAEVKDQTLTWTKKELAALSLLKPGQEAALNFSVGTVASLAMEKDTDKDPNIAVTVTTTSPALSANTNTASNDTVFITKFRTVFTLAAEARYYADDGTAYGIGSLPPKVSATTSYRIIWAATNTTSDATDMVVTMTLPNSVFWTGQNIGRDAGDVTFDTLTREVRWTLNKVPAGTGSRLPKLTAHFDVSITPTVEQVGTVVVLTDIVAGKSTDGYTGSSFNVTASSLTTDLPNDPQAAGKGKVEA